MVLFRGRAVSHQLEPDERIGVGSSIVAPSPDRLAIARFTLPGRSVTGSPRSRRSVVVARVRAPAGNVRSLSTTPLRRRNGQCRNGKDDKRLHALLPDRLRISAPGRGFEFVRGHAINRIQCVMRVSNRLRHHTDHNARSHNIRICHSRTQSSTRWRPQRSRRRCQLRRRHFAMLRPVERPKQRWQPR
jgi:hypothetical protein